MMMLNAFRREIGAVVTAVARMVAAPASARLLIAAACALPCIARAAPDDPYGDGDGHWGMRVVSAPGSS